LLLLLLLLLLLHHHHLAVRDHLWYIGGHVRGKAGRSQALVGADKVSRRGSGAKMGSAHFVRGSDVEAEASSATSKNSAISRRSSSACVKRPYKVRWRRRTAEN
jgi:hypothetical protein